MAIILINLAAIIYINLASLMMMVSSKIDETLESPSEIANSKFFSFVGDDVLLDIFYRLPHYRSVIQCSIVCKRWFYAIDSHSEEFLEYHNQKRSLVLETKKERRKRQKRRKNKQRSWFDLHRRDSSSRYFPSCTLLLYLTKIDGPLYQQFVNKSNPSTRFLNFFPFVDKSNTNTGHTSASFLNFFPWPDDHLVIRSCFKDLFLVSRKCNPKLFYICNPLAKKWIALPEAPRDRLRRGLFRNNDQNTFRVVLMDVILNELHVTMFCSETGEWNESMFHHGGIVGWGYHKFTHSYLSQYQGVSTNDGNLHWLRGRGVLVLNPYKRVHWSMKLPDNFGHYGLKKNIWIRAHLGVVQGRLRLSEVFRRRLGFVLKVWEWNKDREEWILVHNRVKWVAAVTSNTIIQVLAFHPNDGDAIFLARNFDIYRYDIRRDKYKKLGEFPKIPEDEGMISFLAGCFTFMHPLCPTSINS